MLLMNIVYLVFCLHLFVNNRIEGSFVTVDKSISKYMATCLNHEFNGKNLPVRCRILAMIYDIYV